MTTYDDIIILDSDDVNARFCVANKGTNDPVFTIIYESYDFSIAINAEFDNILNASMLWDYLAKHSSCVPDEDKVIVLCQSAISDQIFFLY